MAASVEGVAVSLERDLEALARRLPGIGLGALAATARELARQLDDPGNSSTSKSMCAKALFDALDRLLELVPAEEDSDGVDDLAAKRAARLQRRAAS